MLFVLLALLLLEKMLLLLALLTLLLSVPVPVEDLEVPDPDESRSMDVVGASVVSFFFSDDDDDGGGDNDEEKSNSTSICTGLAVLEATIGVDGRSSTPDLVADDACSTTTTGDGLLFVKAVVGEDFPNLLFLRRSIVVYPVGR